MRPDRDSASDALLTEAAVSATDDSAQTWVSVGPGDGSLPRTEAVKDEVTRRWDVVTPSATKIGRANDPEKDVNENLRRLHDEQHPAMKGHSQRMHRLDKVRIAHALCSALDLTPWERDRVLGIMADVDLTAFGSQRGIPKVTLVAVQYVVDRERQKQLGLHDHQQIQNLSEERLADLYERFTSIKDENAYQELLAAHDLGKTNVNRLNRVLRDQIEEQGLQGAALGRRQFADPNLPDLRERSAGSTSETDADGSSAS